MGANSALIFGIFDQCYAILLVFSVFNAISGSQSIQSCGAFYH